MSKNLFDYGEENLEYLNSKAEEFNNNFNANNVSQSNNSNCNNTYDNSNYGANNSSQKSIPDSVQEEAKNLYEKYKDYSQDNLIQEFLTTSKQKLKEGSLTQDKINSTANALIPFLNDNQRQMMSRLLEQLK